MENEEKIGKLRESLENEQCHVKKMQRENEAKEEEIERLKQELVSVEQNVQKTRKHTDEMAERYCQLIEEETKNKVGKKGHDVDNVISTLYQRCFTNVVST